VPALLLKQEPRLGPGLDPATLVGLHT
jgi:hypothetical protein